MSGPRHAGINGVATLDKLTIVSSVSVVVQGAAAQGHRA
jgi:hypothetical protein